MSRLSQGQLERLPKYARDEIERLDRENARLLDELQVAVGQAPPGNNTWIREISAPDKPIGRSVRVLFQTKTGPVTCNVELDGTLRVAGDRAIVVYPSAANSLTILQRED